MKNTLYTLLLPVCLLIVAALPCHAINTARIAVFQWKESEEIYSRAVEGFTRSLMDAGYRPGRSLTMDFYAAHSDTLTAKEQVQRIKDGKYALVLSLGTKSTQVLQAENLTDVPILYTGVFDPIESKIVTDLYHSNTNLAGSSHRQSFLTQFAIFRELVPTAKRLGVLYRDGEANSLVQLREIRGCKDALGLTDIIETPMQAGDDVAAVTKRLASQVDVLYLPADIYVTSDYVARVITRIANEQQVPLFSALLDPVKQGALISVYSDLYQLGEQVGDMALKILNGTSPGTLPVEYQQTPNVVINDATARALNLRIPDAFYSKVTGVIGKFCSFYNE